MNLLKDGKVVAENIFFAQTWKEKVQGLLGKDKAEPIYFQTRWGIHTFGMKFPIDVLICDSQFQIQKIFMDVQPGKVIYWNPKWDNVFELAGGTIQLQGLLVGEKLNLA